MSNDSPSFPKTASERVGGAFDGAFYGMWSGFWMSGCNPVGAFIGGITSNEYSQFYKINS
jgi:hypothetical protein